LCLFEALFVILKHMKKNVAVVGAGINGLLTAFLISEKYPGTNIDIYDAEDRPNLTAKHTGVTHGSKDALHVTGSESIGFESSVHKDALRNSPEHIDRGWLLKNENDLTDAEKKWRNKFEATYMGKAGLNELDFAHAKLNYRGLAAWQNLAKKYPFIKSHIISTDGVDVYFRNKNDFDDDVIMETEFCKRYYSGGKVKQAANQVFENLYSKKLTVPGISIRVMSLTLELLLRLEKQLNVHFHWKEAVKNASQLTSEIVVWTAGVTHEQPAEYSEHNVQGIVGFWITVSNHGYNRPFKIATPTPSAYINFTPDGSDLHVSGGFGWTGEHTEAKLIKSLAKPTAEHFINQVNMYLGTKIKVEDVDPCVRPSTPTGRPVLTTENSSGKRQIFITGSAKSGTTHAPILSEYVLDQITP
jgi:glycine/D-amino acid oxidase-like deaminating enzyme